jgi:hypothetical protein
VSRIETISPGQSPLAHASWSLAIWVAVILLLVEAAALPAALYVGLSVDARRGVPRRPPVAELLGIQADESMFVDPCLRLLRNVRPQIGLKPTRLAGACRKCLSRQGRQPRRQNIQPNCQGAHPDAHSRPVGGSGRKPSAIRKAAAAPTPIASAARFAHGAWRRRPPPSPTA